MKNSKIKALTIILAGVMVMSSGCLPMLLAGSNGRQEEKKEDRKEKGKKDKDKDKNRSSGVNTEYEKEFGTYSIPDEWIEVTEHSREPNYYAYAVEGTEKDRKPNNIAVAFGEQPYGEDQFDEFKQAALANYGSQIGDSEVEIHSSGFTSEQGYIVYVFELIEEDATTIQYYILAEKKYCMVSAAIYDFDAAEEDHIKDVAHQIVDGFVFSD